MKTTPMQRRPQGIDTRTATAAGEAFGLYALLADTGPVSARELGALLRIDEAHAESWLAWQTELDYLHRDSAGRYANFCAIAA